ncbi:MAG: aldehyde ferredoxin oxidoreductase family protein [Chloroflexi bacterium]|nr:aldehyde ferredoxin oxidoreductase family protein [Chloroflexota bacterium]
MSYGHWGKMLRVNLTRGSIAVEELDEAWMRKYVGGWGFIAYYMLKEIPAGIDPLSPENLLIYATGPVTGQPVAGGGRHMIGGKSPLTGGFAGSEVGGFFGAELKRAGWDMILFEGASPSPVYLYIKEDDVRLLPADDLWGMETWDVEQKIRETHSDRFIRVSQIGPAGENLALIANVVHDSNRAAGRTGMGALMGSKKLKAVAVRGSRRPPTADPDKLAEMARWFREHYQETGSGIFSTLGTNRMIRVNNGAGGLPTRNFQQGVFEGYEKICAETIMETITVRRDTCYGCPVRCKWVVKVEDEDYPVDPKYGGPEYETTAAMGCLLGIDDLRVIAHANLLCNAYGLDTIGTGMSIAFAMECFEKGLLSLQDTGGIELTFGNGEAAIAMIHKIAKREGLGDLLAQGTRRAARKIGGEAPQFTVEIKGQEVAMHDPRVKYGHGLGIAVSPTGADHMHSAHDSGYQTEAGIKDLKPLGILEPLPWDDLSAQKASMMRQVMMWRIVYNLTGICMFHAWTPQQEAKLIAAATGWNTSVMELWLAGERAYDMARAFNAREGFGAEDDMLPKRLFEPLPQGPVAGKVYSREQFLAARDVFYEMMGWDENGVPTRAKLENLGIGWVADV